MEEEGFIKYKSGRIYINPNFIWRGTPKGREEAEKIFLSVNCEKKDI